jgi:hypothetical protein
MKPFNNPYSWTNASNMLFIDEPTTVGLSYSIPIPGYKDGSTIIQLPNATCPDYAQNYGTCGTFSKPDLTLTANTTEGAAPNMWKTLQGFMGAFPQYSRNGFSFTTESYGGKNPDVRIVCETYIEFVQDTTGRSLTPTSLTRTRRTSPVRIRSSSRTSSSVMGGLILWSNTKRTTTTPFIQETRTTTTHTTTLSRPNGTTICTAQETVLIAPSSAMRLVATRFALLQTTSATRRLRPCTTFTADETNTICAS